MGFALEIIVIVVVAGSTSSVNGSDDIVMIVPFWVKVAVRVWIPTPNAAVVSVATPFAVSALRSNVEPS